MNQIIEISIKNFIKLKISNQARSIGFILLTLSGLLVVPIQKSNSEEIYLKCTGNYEVNRGALIKPDWETSYLTINLDGLNSTIVDKGIKKKGSTHIRRNLYTIKFKDKKNILRNIYKINENYGTYIVEYPQIDRTLIGTCQKGRG